MAKKKIEAATTKAATKIDLWPITDVKPYERNAKKHPPEQVDKLARVIKRHGFDVPIVVDEDGVIIKGHGRLLAAKQLGLQRVPVIVRDDLTDAQVREARIADNTVSETGWDFDQLKKDLTLGLPVGFEMDITGFDISELLKQDEGAKLIDGRMNDEARDDWAGAEIKQIVLSFQNDEYVKVIAQLDKLMTSFNVESYTEVVLCLLKKHK